MTFQKSNNIFQLLQSWVKKIGPVFSPVDIFIENLWDEYVDIAGLVLMLFNLLFRFCLLLQSVSRLCDKSILNDRLTNKKKRPQSRTISCTMSVGLISRRFWDKITEVQDTYHQMEKEVFAFVFFHFEIYFREI